ncbi:YeiH family protein [Azospirillum thermophilum]|uniref:YeiH family putative sulfate export transporter n=1 Tax=Azospirillum thermophilum TaxID=2202148 RepID=A0A2S2CRX8_9PROT|nr:YeiH family protein [Azospirillum thermophilum]AWK87236.1 YeiH family putative sulfate export transporter [Azospirillum thermophilum]
MLLTRSLPLVPGTAVAAALAGAAMALHGLPGLSAVSPLVLAVGLGMAVRGAAGVPDSLRPGLSFAVRPLLRLAVVLLGAQLTVGQVMGLGGAGLAVVAASLAASLWFSAWLGRRLGVEQRLARLIGAGTSICGASAVLAVNSVTRAEEEDVAYAIACVTLCGTAAMLLYPLLAGPLGLDAHGFGLWAGASIHEVAQAVATAFQDGSEAGEVGTVAKLSRVLLLAPVVIGLGLAASRTAVAPAADGTVAKRPPVVPGFVAGFLLLIALNSLGLLPGWVRAAAGMVAPVLLTMALAAMGLDANPAALRAKGLRPFLLAVGASLFLALFSLTGILWFC